jgi:hypothetical protein
MPEEKLFKIRIEEHKLQSKNISIKLNRLILVGIL